MFVRNLAPDNDGTKIFQRSVLGPKEVPILVGPLAPLPFGGPY